MNTRSCSYLVIGSGIAGLTAAHKLSRYGHTLLLTKKSITSSATSWAQGGIAAVMKEDDDLPQYHFEDTIYAGSGLCHKEAVSILVKEGPGCVQELIDLGAKFDKIGENLLFTKEGAHQKKRILHAADATGKEIERTLGKTLLNEKKVEIIENAHVLKLILHNEECIGCYAKINKKIIKITANATILATGGIGHIYAQNTNPSISTGDGITLAKQIGARLQDMEFVQFHPTTMKQAQNKTSCFLISEAVRGEGGILRNQNGDEFMSQYHKMADLAPRDIVARAIYSEIHLTNTPHVYLDVSRLSKNFSKRFPTIYKHCLNAKIDIKKDWIPVSPAAHYHMGGINTNLWGKTSINRLFAVGETACTGLHGANRLASNSLLEGLVFGTRLAKEASQLDSISAHHTKNPNTNTSIISLQKRKKIKKELKDMMWKNVGIIRNNNGLKKTLSTLKHWQNEIPYNINCTKHWELKSMIEVATYITEAALQRKESRGAHYREDYPTSSTKAEHSFF